MIGSRISDRRIAKWSWIGLLLALAGCAGVKPEPQVSRVVPAVRAEQVRRVSTAVPFPRGLQIVNGQLVVLARGRVRESGGVSAAVADRAGTIYTVNPDIGEPITAEVSEAVKSNGTILAEPTSPPFFLWDRTANPPTRDRKTDRPYCSLRFDAKTHSYYLCAFSGIDKPQNHGSSFSKNTSDAILRYDLRTRKWYEVERHSLEAGGNYPHHDPYTRPPPHGWLNGPDNCLVVGRSLYAVAKDNSVLVRYDLSSLRNNPEAGVPPSEYVLGEQIRVKGLGTQRYLGHSMLAERDGYLYIGYRTSSVIVRLRLDEQGLPVQPVVAELIARFDPYDPMSRKSANLTDMVFDATGDLYVISAQPARIYRFRPDSHRVFDGRTGQSPAWADLAALTNNPAMKSENVLVDDRRRVFITSGDAYGFQNGAGGTVYRIDPLH